MELKIIEERLTANKRAQVEMMKEKAAYEEKVITLESRIRNME